MQKSGCCTLDKASLSTVQSGDRLDASIEAWRRPGCSKWELVRARDLREICHCQVRREREDDDRHERSPAERSQDSSRLLCAADFDATFFAALSHFCDIKPC